MKMEPFEEFARQVAALPTEAQEEFYEKLKEHLSDEEIKATRVFVSVLDLFMNPAKYELLKEAACDALCEQFFGKTCERRRTHDDPVLVARFSNFII